MSFDKIKLQKIYVKLYNSRVKADILNAQSCSVLNTTWSRTFVSKHFTFINYIVSHFFGEKTGKLKREVKIKFCCKAILDSS